MSKILNIKLSERLTEYNKKIENMYSRRKSKHRRDQNSDGDSDQQDTKISLTRKSTKHKLIRKNVTISKQDSTFTESSSSVSSQIDDIKVDKKFDTLS